MEREAADSALRSAPWAALNYSLRSTECPEARLRLTPLRTSATIREVDRLAGGKFPRADDLWPCEYSAWYCWATRLYGWTPEFYRAPFDYEGECGDWGNENAKRQTHRTRAALILYANRTGDWDTIRSILK